MQALEKGQAIASTYSPAVRAAVQKYDNQPAQVTAAMALPGFPVGSPDETAIQGIASAMVQYGILSEKYSTEIDNGSLVQAMFRPAY